ncbi:MAG: hypothetical protein ACERKZ_04705 [Lachnotalea sp.]
MKQRLIIISILLLLFTSACSKEQNVTTSSTTTDTQEVTEPAKQSTTDNTQNAISTQAQESIVPTDNKDTAIDDSAAIAPNTTVMEVPPFEYYTSNQTSTSETPSISLEMSSSEPNDITDTDKWFEQNKLSLNQYQNFDNTSTDLPSEIDTMYENLILTNTFHDDSYIYCMYGTNYSDAYILRIYDLNTYAIVYTFDFSNYLYEPNNTNEEALSFPQQINWASVKDGILYVSNRHRTYASTTNYKNAYITTIDLKDMHVIWRSDALISNAENFLVLDNVIICGYGFTDEDDYLYELDRSNGKVINSIPLKSAPAYLIQKDNQIFVRTYNMNYMFSVVPK